MNNRLEGVVIRSTGSWYSVRIASGAVIESRMPGIFRLNGLPVTNPVAIGDGVYIKKEEGLETGKIIKILDRKNYVIRESPRKKCMYIYSQAI